VEGGAIVSIPPPSEATRYSRAADIEGSHPVGEAGLDGSIAGPTYFPSLSHRLCDFEQTFGSWLVRSALVDNRDLGASGAS
jgi:hypothetical protein